MHSFTTYIAQCEVGSVRLTGGPNEFEGRVELCLDGSWGQVCVMGWTNDDAEVVCRQLGYSTDRCELLTDLSHTCLNCSCILTLSSNSCE